MAYYWPQYGVAIEVDDDPHLLPFEEEAFPDTTVYHVTTDVICDPESFSALAHHIARIHDIDPTCFMIVSHVTEVSGRGFSLEKDYQAEE